MLQKAFLACLVSILSLALPAQVRNDVLPASFGISKNFMAAPALIQLAPPTIAEIEKLAKVDEKNGEPLRFSRSIFTTLTLDNSGNWSDLPDGSRIWRVQITSTGALALIPFFNRFYIPDGASLHVYTPDREEITGAFTAANNPADGYYCTGLIHGETLVMEYYEPGGVRGKGIISMNEIGYAYRDVPPLNRSQRNFGNSDVCEININCSEGSNYQNQKHSVARILIQSSLGQAWCTGTLLNNVRQDCTPYFLSAQHCSQGSSTNQLSQWVFYFNYEAPGCSDPASEGSLGNNVVIGCTKVSDSNDGGGETGSDFVLLQLNSQPAAGYNVYYSGWNNSSTAPASGVCIHHPNGDIKKISSYTSTPVSTKWNPGFSQFTHWRVTWAATANGHGVTEAGSSGAPLINAQGQVVGTLSGGDSYCQTPTGPDLYGKFSYHWNLNGSNQTRQLKPWLDPDNTGATSLNGIAYPCGTLVTNDAGIIAITHPSGAVCNSSVTPTVTLKNFGSSNLTSVKINYALDGNQQQYDWSGNLTPLSTAAVNLPVLSIVNGNHTFNAATTLPNGFADGNTGNDQVQLNFSAAPTNSSLNLYLSTDNRGSETSWEISDANGKVLYRGGPYGNMQLGQVFNIPVCLASGCYVLSLYDTGGDGMDGNIQGEMSLTGQGGAVVYATLGDTDFGRQADYNFCFPFTGIEETDASRLQIFPNPSAGLFSLVFKEAGEKHLRIFDATGRLAISKTGSAENISLDLTTLPRGVYILRAETHAGITFRKLVLK